MTVSDNDYRSTLRDEVLFAGLEGTALHEPCIEPLLDRFPRPDAPRAQTLPRNDIPQSTNR